MKTSWLLCKKNNMDKRVCDRKLNKVLAVVVMFATVFVLLFSAMFLVEHAHHHCEGDECPICMVMAQCSKNIKTLSSAIIFVSVGLLTIAPLRNIRTSLVTDFFNNSLVFQKVRMNN